MSRAERERVAKTTLERLKRFTAWLGSGKSLENGGYRVRAVSKNWRSALDEKDERFAVLVETMCETAMEIDQCTQLILKYEAERIELVNKLEVHNQELRKMILPVIKDQFGNSYSMAVQHTVSVAPSRRHNAPMEIIPPPGG